MLCNAIQAARRQAGALAPGGAASASCTQRLSRSRRPGTRPGSLARPWQEQFGCGQGGTGAQAGTSFRSSRAAAAGRAVAAGAGRDAAPAPPAVARAASCSHGGSHQPRCSAGRRRCRAPAADPAPAQLRPAGTGRPLLCASCTVMHQSAPVARARAAFLQGLWTGSNLEADSVLLSH